MAGYGEEQGRAGETGAGDSGGGMADALCAERLQLLSHPVRLSVVRTLQHGNQTVSDLLQAIPIEQNALSHHLKRLREAGIIAAKRQGKFVVYALLHRRGSRARESIDLGCCTISFRTASSGSGKPAT